MGRSSNGDNTARLKSISGITTLIVEKRSRRTLMKLYLIKSIFLLETKENRIE
jgi:hypothetical protein